MKLLSVLHEGKQKLCLLDNQEGLRDLGPLGLFDMAQAIARAETLNSLTQKAGELPLVPSNEVSHLPVVSKPEKIICVGLNYKKHIEEVSAPTPEHPVIFAKYANALAAHEQEVARGACEKMDYEAELVIVIGKTCRDVTVEQAPDYCFGYTCGNDFSARDLQLLTSQWTLGKTPDGFAPIGPVLVTADEINPDNLHISCAVNGQTRQAANTGDMLFRPFFLVSFLSRYMTLKPGDLIFTGTPSGVGQAMPEDNRNWLMPGDLVEVSIEGIGSLKNRIV